ncbi:MAG: anhydro-N-acetylmuramic acid kinase [Gelidibacter sp.]
MNYNVIGVMSGTSLDGIDLAYITFKFNSTWKFDITYAETVNYSKEWTEKLKKLVQMSADDLQQLDHDYTLYLAKVINQFIKTHHISDIDAICSHGHTALHQPEKGLTYQIGNLPKIATLLHQTVVCNFRVADVKLGGQGAPLVPIGDALLFPEYDFCLNLGGFANISTEINNRRIAYDVCPVNIVLNQYVHSLGLDFDNRGQLAASGNIHQELLSKLNALEFYGLKHPKSLGLEWVKTVVFPLIDSFKIHTKDVLKTFVEHISTQISKEINTKTSAKILVTGGGVYNDFLMQQIKNKTHNTIIVPDNSIIEFKEALIFGLLGVLKLRNEINCLSSVTGASKNHSSGIIYKSIKML